MGCKRYDDCDARRDAAKSDWKTSLLEQMNRKIFGFVERIKETE